MNIHLTEIFGPTLQGEGILAGTVSTFIRTAGCSVGCKQCDTKHSWPFIKSGRQRTFSLDEIVGRVKWNATPYVVVTGGEPMECEEPEVFYQMLKRIAGEAYSKITLELSGSVAGEETWVDRLLGVVDLWSFSPKVAALEAKRPPIIPFIGETIGRAIERGAKAQLKFVVDDVNLETCLDQISEILAGVRSEVPVILQTLTREGESHDDTLSRSRLIFRRAMEMPTRQLGGKIQLGECRFQFQQHVLLGLQ